MSQSIRVNTGVDKASSYTRTSCASTMAKQAPESALYKTISGVKASCDALAAAGTDLADAEAAVQVALTMLRQARQKRKSKIVAFDNAYNVCIAQVEKHAAAPEDVTALALTVLERKSNDLAPPVAIDAKFLLLKGIIRVRVTLPPGVKACLVEVTTDPTDPASYKRLPGTGKLRDLTGYGPGTYWFRATSLRSDGESEPTPFVPMIVP